MPHRSVLIAIVGLGIALFLAGGCASSRAVSAADIKKRHQAVAQSDRLIVPGERIGPIRIGMGADELRAMLGQPEEIQLSRSDLPSSATSWGYSSLGLRVVFDQSLTPSVSAVNTVDFRHFLTPGVGTVEGTAFHTAEGIALNASPFDIKRLYGPCQEVKYLDARGGAMEYPVRGVTFEVWDGKIFRISVKHAG